MNNTVPVTPLEKIALSCSGGGYRAASFHLGALAYLNRLHYNGRPLLERVEMLSTVSGGTITGVVYALRKQQGQSFSEIYNFLMEQLRTFDLIKAGIEKLDPGAVWQNPGKTKNLINAFAELYHLHFTNGATFADLEGELSHLKTVVFNSTEFTNAIDFRFRNKAAGYCGNYYNMVQGDAAAEIRLADAIAASSCFPGGFEPILWPDDFMHEASPAIKQIKEKKLPVSGLMDGGIYDNQGIDAILNYRKNDAVPYFDLVIVSDVASPYMTPYAPFAEGLKKGFNEWTVGEIKTKSKKINLLTNAALLFLITLLVVLPVFNGYTATFWTGLSLGLAAGFLLFLAMKAIALRKARAGLAGFSGRLLKLVPEFYKEKLAGLKMEALSLHRVEPLLVDRLQSLVTLLMNVFLKVVRRLNYKILYANDNYTYRRISNLIKGLTREDFDSNSKRRSEDGAPDEKLAANSVLLGTYDQVVGPLISDIVETASGFGTTLWFTEQEQLAGMLQNLVVAGEFTMCCNLLEYLEKVIYEKDSGFDALDGRVREEITKTYELCKTDWEHFRQEPAFMVNEPKT
ncbi:MAG TPA: patatin-like phospholipase family protein [Mucilaginibacter sp.]|nr:patatin-like phospholipase family protein [Mucilaginibacter sp.]